MIDAPADFYSSRLSKKQRKRTLVDELLADQDFKKEVKKRYVDIVINNKKKFKNQFRHIQREERSKNRRNKRKGANSQKNDTVPKRNQSTNNIAKNKSKKNKS